MADNSTVEPTSKPIATLLSRLGLSSFGTTERKTVTFGDASAVTGGAFWSILTILIILFLWYLSEALLWVDPNFLPGPRAVWIRLIETSREGYRGVTLWQHVSISLFRVVAGFLSGCLAGIPLGLAMGLSNPLRGIFDPIVEFFRPIPPLAFIPLIILYVGIGEDAKILMLFLAAIWIMAIAARSGVLGVKLSKVHAAYSLGASKWQILRYVILPNALPDIFVGMRVALGVCWGTLVAAEFLGAQEGLGIMMWIAQKFFITELVIIGILLIGIIAIGMDVIMRLMERWLIPWRGKG